MDSPPTPPSPPCLSSSKHNTPYRSRLSKLSPSPEHRRFSRNASLERKRKNSPDSKLSRSHRHSRSSDRDKDQDRSNRKHSRRERSKSRGRSKSQERSRRNRTRSRSRERQRQRDTSRRQHKNHETDYNIAISPLPAVVQPNVFANDGSFMEMFKKMQNEMQPEPKATTSVLEDKPVVPPPLMVGKRRGGRILKTGLVAKPKVEQTQEKPKDAWSLYMAEVKKYREVCCQEEDNTRPLVK